MENTRLMISFFGMALVIYLLYSNNSLKGGGETTNIPNTMEPTRHPAMKATIQPVVLEQMHPTTSMPTSAPVVQTQGDMVEGNSSDKLYATLDYNNSMMSPEQSMNELNKDSNKINPSDLLPNYNLKSNLVDDFNMDKLNDNYLTARPETIIGINSVGSSLRNANYGLRSEPANPQNLVSPWGISTITPDNYRRPMEIGCDM